MMGHVMMSKKFPSMRPPVDGIFASMIGVGNIARLIESGSAVEYRVVHQGKPSGMYDDSCDGTWLMRRDLIEARTWDSDNVNTLEISDIYNWLKSDMLGKFDEKTRNIIKQVKIPYRSNGGSGGSDQSGSNGLSCKIFIPSGYEVGLTTSVESWFPHDGDTLAYFEVGNGESARNKRVMRLNGNTMNWWLRSPRTINRDYVCFVGGDGGHGSDCSAATFGILPTLILPSNAVFDENSMILKDVV